MAQQNKYVAGIKTAAQIIGAVSTVVGAAGGLKETVQPALESEGAQAAVSKAKGALGGIAHKATSAKDSVTESLKSKKEEKNLAKQLKEARQTVLESASQTFTYKEYVKTVSKTGLAAAALSTGLFASPGCFAIATYSSLDFDKDLTDYSYIYVGSGSVLGEAVESACSRDGDPDVYADVKYKQNVHIYLYPCLETEMPAKLEALQQLFSALGSDADGQGQ